MAIQLKQAEILVTEKKFDQAIAQHIDPVIEYFEKYRKENVRVYSSGSLIETLAYLLPDPNSPDSERNKSAAVYSDLWGQAYYLKGYTLVELGRRVEARAALESAIALSPFRSQYHSELGNLLLTLKEFGLAQTSFTSAEKGAREFSPEQLRTEHLGRALRGQGYILIEMGQFDAAENIYKKCLELNPKDQRAKGQIDYIVKTREKKADEEQLKTDPSMRDFQIGWRLAEAQAISPSVQDYVRRYVFGQPWDDEGTKRAAIMPGEKAAIECLYSPKVTATRARLVFQLDARGTVIAAHTDTKDLINDCLASRLVGHRIPPPPRPIFYCNRYERTGSNQFLLSTCGPRPLVRACTVEEDGLKVQFQCKNG